MKLNHRIETQLMWDQTQYKRGKKHLYTCEREPHARSREYMSESGMPNPQG